MKPTNFYPRHRPFITRGDRGRDIETTETYEAVLTLRKAGLKVERAGPHRHKVQGHIITAPALKLIAKMAEGRLV